MKRLVYLDVAKALSIILVVIGHYNQLDFPIWYQKIVFGIYTFHIPLFMFASGYLYSLTGVRNGYGDFLWKKFRRLMIPYFVVSFIVITVKLLFQGFAYVSNPVTLWSYLRMFYRPEAGFYLWFVWSLWCMFAIVPMCKTKQQRLVLFFITLVAHIIPLPETDFFCFTQTKKMFVYFMLGVVASDYKDSFAPLRRIPLGVYFVLFMVVELLYAAFPIELYPYKFVIAFVGIAFMVSLSRYIAQNGGKATISCLLLISSACYVIYLFHTMFEGFAKAVMHKMAVYVDGGQIAFFLLGIVFATSLGLLVPILLNRWVLNRYKVTKFLFGLK